ncbi:leucine-rich repeat domain-containing protein [Clostridiales bacterium FE2010]|nr:leucine-rich repeat domain-containing protein [Clostridiales bacterium FE2010]
MKKCLSMILAVLLLCGGIFAVSLAEGEDLYEYTVNGKNVVITGVKDKEIKKAEVPAEIDGKKVTAIGSQAFYGCNDLKTVVLPEGLQKIEYCAFENCTELESINIPDSVTEIGAEAFAACFVLENVEISPYHKVFGVNSDILFRKKDMTLIKYLGQVEEDATIIANEYDVFWGMKTIANDAFNACKLTAINLPTTVQNIESCAFVSCHYMKEMVIPEGVKTIGSQVFMHDYALESITIPSTVTKIGDGIFNGCDKLKEINISPKNRNYETKDLLLIEKKTQKIIGASCVIEGKLTIPDGIKAIGSVAFQSCGKITELTIPDSVKTIEWGAFWNCDQMTIKGHAGSAAQKYCEENNMKFEVIE